MIKQVAATLQSVQHLLICNYCEGICTVHMSPEFLNHNGCAQSQVLTHLLLLTCLSYNLCCYNNNLTCLLFSDKYECCVSENKETSEQIIKTTPKQTNK